MKKFLLAAAAALGLLVGSFGSAQADHNQPPILPLIPNTPVIQRTLEKGFVTYWIDDRLRAYPNFEKQARDVALAGYKDVGIEAIQVSDPAAADIKYNAPTDANFVATCGSGAAGCIVYWTQQANVYVRISLAFNDFRSLIAHEGINYGHAFGQHEMYNDRLFQCLTDRWWTVMSCGTFVWIPQEFDKFTIWNVVVPDVPSQVSSRYDENFFYVSYNGYRADGGAAHHGNNKLDNATRVSVFIQRPGDDQWYWIGHYGPKPTPGSNQTFAFWRFQFCDVPDTVVGIRPENGLPLTYLYSGISYISGNVTVAGTCP